MDIWLRLLAAHFIGDFAFQSTWMSMEKGKAWDVVVYHAATYTATFVLLGFGFSVWGFALLFLSHILVDTCKARWHIITSIWADQLWHLATLGFIWYFLGTCATTLCK